MCLITRFLWFGQDKYGTRYYGMSKKSWHIWDIYYFENGPDLLNRQYLSLAIWRPCVWVTLPLPNMFASPYVNNKDLEWIVILKRQVQRYDHCTFMFTTCIHKAQKVSLYAQKRSRNSGLGAPEQKSLQILTMNDGGGHI